MMEVMEKELEVARELARDAGRILLEFYASGAKVQWKGHDDPVTAADHAANDMLVRELNRRFPADAILSEEVPDDPARLEKDRVWMVEDRKSTRLNSSHVAISYAVFCLKKKKQLIRLLPNQKKKEKKKQ